MLKWFIIGTLLYYAVLLWRYRDSLGTWFTGGKREPEQPESKPTVKAGNGDCLVGASRYRMGQMRTNGDILAGTPPCGVCKGPVQKEPFSHVTDRLFMFLANIYPVLFYGSRVYV